MLKKHIYYLIIFLFLLFQAFFYVKFLKAPKTSTESKTKAAKSLKYVPLGDSYTIGLGIDEDGRWPNVLVKHLKEKGINIDLIENPAVSGFTVRDAIENELPVVERIKPDFVTVLIGANDNFSGRTVEDYRRDMIELLDKLQLVLEKPENIVLVTIPDYAKSPGVKEDSSLSRFIGEYNRVIKEESLRRGLSLADIYPVSQTITGAEDYIEDGLHPSPLGYEKWEKIILPVVIDRLQGGR